MNEVGEYTQKRGMRIDNEAKGETTEGSMCATSKHKKLYDKWGERKEGKVKADKTSSS